MELKQGYLIRLFEHDRLAFRHFIRNLLKKWVGLEQTDTA